jgi:hypothetical protein
LAAKRGEGSATPVVDEQMQQRYRPEQNQGAPEERRVKRRNKAAKIRVKSRENGAVQPYMHKRTPSMFLGQERSNDDGCSRKEDQKTTLQENADNKKRKTS